MLWGGFYLSEDLCASLEATGEPILLEWSMSLEWTLCWRQKHSKFLKQQSNHMYLQSSPCIPLRGAWERMIGISRKILDSMLLRNNAKEFTHEVLTTFMPDVCFVVISRPLISVSTDHDNADILTPNTLLTQKTRSLPESLPSLDTKDVYKSQWKQVHRNSGESGVNSICQPYNNDANGLLRVKT